MQRQISDLISHIRAVAQQANIRFPCWLTGSAEWSEAIAREVLKTQGQAPSYAIISSRQWSGLQTCPVHQAHRLLGQEVELLIYDGFSGINPDTLGQISGLLKGGGLLLFLTPAPLSADFFDDPEKQRLLVEPYTCADVGNHFLEHLRQCFTAEPSVLRFDQKSAFKSELFTQFSTRFSSPPLPASISSALQDQQKVINDIHFHLQASGQQCCVLTAARGRGKSSALGILARDFMKAGKNVVVTAPRSDAVESLFQHAADEADFERTRYQVRNKNTCLIYRLPVDVCNEASDADILLVDEAAGIPVHLLARYLDKFSKIIFATTTQGYEGTGQGFALRFLSILRNRVNSLACYTLAKPVRWSEHDPLEPFFNRLLILDAVAAPIKNKGTDGSQAVSVHRVDYRVVDPGWLVSHPQRLRDLFGLMVDAHYRTTPGDLRIMLDSPNLNIWIAESAGQIIGACLVAGEGGLDDELVQRIWEGRRRPRGHLIPQLLIAQEGYLEAAGFKALRIVRIAVQDQYRRHKIASGLLEAIQHHKNQPCDLIGASFAVTPSLLDFWQQQGFQVIRIGTQLDPVSGAYAALVLKGVSVSAKQILPLWQSEFQRRLDYLQGEWLKSLPVDILQRIQCSGLHEQRAEQDDWRDLSGFAFHFRSYESTAFVFAGLAKRYRYLWDQDVADERIRYVIEIRVIQQRSESEVMQHCRVAQRKMLLTLLRSAAAYLYQQGQVTGAIG
ncbi:tRNA(Met) cytidine acetyltransferase TmcA [Neptunomonas qingdaonensis]|uniref:tRNA(Met) cytidine acetyltransferase TmcA n=1 Tax=Neptunomonas qingdaonensis TaxID=1045558 RepID=A0A1I2NWD4_9GAMM|nr:GNAT family N-acetyltransferase [Neptunomonas qingdaonensis]SFG07998.1 tRNA(Met) cytidine acetyltransferase [Neptunomonas qingdaonensis]